MAGDFVPILQLVDIAPQLAIAIGVVMICLVHHHLLINRDVSLGEEYSRINSSGAKSVKNAFFWAAIDGFYLLWQRGSLIFRL